MEVDIGNLLCSYKVALPSSLAKITSEELQNLATSVAQECANKLWELPTETVEGVVVAQLPNPNIRLPREKPCPKAKMDTKWSKFARAKGITNKKKGRLVWSDDLKQWIPRFGYKSENNQKDWMLEVPQNADPFEDQFEKKTTAKRERIAKNEHQRLKNIARNSKGKVTGVGMMPTTRKEGKSEINERLVAAKHSTASMGDFDEKVKDENKIRVSKKRKFDNNFRDNKKEMENNLELIARIKAKKPVVNKDKAARNEQVEQDTKRATKRKAEGESFGSRDKRPKTPKKQKGTSKHSMSKKRK